MLSEKQRWVPVVSSTGVPLMPCSPVRVRKLVTKGKAVKKWRKGFFYIQLLDREIGEVQDIAVGIDPGSMREGYTVLSAKQTYLNINAYAIDGGRIKKKMAARSASRRSRRNRKAPYRAPRFFNRKSGKNWLPPSTKARWQLKLNIVKHLMRLYPVSLVSIEDVAVGSVQGDKRWNCGFSPIMNGKNWLYRELLNLGLDLHTFAGNQTASFRRQLGLVKSKMKLSRSFDAHCVDSWVIANKVLGDRSVVDMTEILELIPNKPTRRQLHKLNKVKGGVRYREGGTMSLGIKKGTLVVHNKWGNLLVGGNNGKNRLTGHCPFSFKRVSRDLNTVDLRLIAHSPWRVLATTAPVALSQRRIGKLNRLCLKLALLGIPDSKVFQQLKLKGN